MKVTVRLTLDVDPAAWTGKPEEAVSALDEIDLATQVREHAAMVLTDLFEDQGWLAGQRV